MDYHHVPVLAQEVIDNLVWRQDGIYVDATVGGGGHARLLLERAGPEARLIAIDQDPNALAAAKQTLGDKAAQVVFIHSNFLHIERIVTELQCEPVDGILFDLGVSSPQLDAAERGFSYRHDAPLDMRMDPSSPVTAADLLATLTEEELAKILLEYGEERWARRIARFIVEERRRSPIMTTGHLVDVIKAAIPKGARSAGPHPARRTFQALRIAVNRELEVLERALVDAIKLLRPRGRIAVISFHSLEDRIVKQTFARLAAGCTCPPELPVCICGKQAELRILTRKPIVPTEREIADNPRARSAKLRVAEKVLLGKGDEY
ncbi:MAG TPA: 16S rRNA (cytosine(1402)-N(4))-methyltransferase RsmH [Firmicutes bacterium]|nr:16S rRNA (cytosine(1402)-N(4))-methyltransferase RsmH [Bacillota bacterium]